MESGESSGFFHLFLGLRGFWFLASTYLHNSGFFLQNSFPRKLLVFASWYLWLAGGFGLAFVLL